MAFPLSLPIDASEQGIDRIMRFLRPSKPAAILKSAPEVGEPDAKAAGADREKPLFQYVDRDAKKTLQDLAH
jgi:hypothetical protein